MVISMQGGAPTQGTPNTAVPQQHLEPASAVQTLSYAARLAGGILGGVADSRLDRKRFEHDIELAVAARALARLDDGTLCFVSDVFLRGATAVDLELAQSDVDDAQSSLSGCGHRRWSPPELTHVFTLHSLPRLLLVRALRDEQYVVHPKFAVRLRNVRQRWYELCSRHGLSPNALAWENTRTKLERSRIVFVFSTPQASHLTSMMFWSDAVAVASTIAEQQHASTNKAASLCRHVVQQRQGEPYFAAHQSDAQRLCSSQAPWHVLELAKVSFRREVQLFPRELSFAVLQDSLNEQFLMVLHALQKMQRSVIVDALVCEYLVARFLIQSPSGPGIMEISNHAYTSPTAPSAPSKVSSMARIEYSASQVQGIWSRLREAQQQLASFRLVYISGADIAFGSDYIHHVPRYASLSKLPRSNLLEADPVELLHDAAILDLGVKVFLETLMHMQRLLRRVRVPWGSLSRILEQHLSLSDGPTEVLGRCTNAGLVHTEGVPLMRHGSNAGSRNWFDPSTAVVCFVSDVGPIPLSEDRGAVAPPPPCKESPPYFPEIPTRPPAPTSKPLNPYCKPFVLEKVQPMENAGDGNCNATASSATSDPDNPDQLPSSVEMLVGLTAPSSLPTSSPSNPSQDTDVVPLSSLSQHRRVVQKKGHGASTPKSVLSQLFLTLERLEGKGVGDDDRASATSSVRGGGTPAVRDSTPAPSTPTTGNGPSQSTSTSGGGGPGSRFISAITWLFESALEDVSHGPKHNTNNNNNKGTGGSGDTRDASSAFSSLGGSDESSRRRKLYYSTLATFFETAAKGDTDEGSAVRGDHPDPIRVEWDDDDDDLLLGATRGETVRKNLAERSSAARGDERWQDGGIVVPSRNRPQLSSEQKRAMRQLHARLTQSSMMESQSEAEPWESVKFFFGKAEVIAGLSL